MPIPFKPGINIKDLKQVSFSMSIKDCVNINIILNPLKKAGVIKDVPLGQPSLVASPAFIVYRNRTLRYIVNL